MKKLFLLSITFLCALCVSAKGKLKQLPPMKFSNETVKIHGIVKKSETSISDTVVIAYRPLLGELETKHAILNANGEFDLQFNPGSSIMVSISVSNQHASAIVIPGETTSVIFDASLLNHPKKRAWLFSGAVSDFNNDIANAPDSIQGMRTFRFLNGPGLNTFKGKNLNDVKQILTNHYNAYAAQMDARDYCDAYKEYEKTVARIYLGMMLSSGTAILNYANQQQGQWDMPADYFSDYVKEDPFVRNAAFYSPFGNMLAPYTEEMGKTMKHQFGLPEGYEKLVLAQKFYSSINQEFVPLTDAQIDSVKTQTPEFAQTIVKANDELKAKIERNKNSTDFTIKSISPDLKGEDVFKSLVAPYMGKPVLVDFWATWCGPCRAAMKTIQPVKEELWGKVAFIYITGPSSPKGTWNNMIPDIHGDHYYVTKEQWETLLKQFDSQGIPTYVIVNQEGKVQNKFIGYPGNDTMKAELTKK